MRLDKKLTEIEHRISRGRKRRRRSKGNSPPSRDSERERRLANQVEMGSSSESIASEKTGHSAMEMGEAVKPKIHRASFNDFSTTSYKLN